MLTMLQCGVKFTSKEVYINCYYRFSISNNKVIAIKYYVCIMEKVSKVAQHDPMQCSAEVHTEKTREPRPA